MQDVPYQNVAHTYCACNGYIDTKDVVLIYISMDCSFIIRHVGHVASTSKFTYNFDNWIR